MTGEATGGSETMTEGGTEVDDATPVGRSPGRNLPIAIISGLLLAIAFASSLLWHPAAFSLLVALLCTLAYLEAGRVLATQGVRVEVVVLLVATYVTLAGAYQARHAGQAIGVAVLFGGAVVWLLAEHRRGDVVARLATTLLLGLWVGFLASFAVLLVTRPGIGPAATAVVVGGAVLADIGGYVFGTLLGRRAIAPSVSPKKTWEGLVGGLLLAAVVAALVMPILETAFTPLRAAAVAALAGMAGFFGDLAESMIKRDLGVKDLGAILPGHGGVLDRVDGILFSLPVGYFAVELLI